MQLPNYFVPKLSLTSKNYSSQLIQNQNQSSNNCNENAIKPPFNLLKKEFYQSFQNNHFISQFFYTNYSNFLKQKVVRFFILSGFFGYLVINFFILKEIKLKKYLKM